MLKRLTTTRTVPSLVLHSRAYSPGKLVLWLGMTKGAQSLIWFLNGNQIEPQPLLTEGELSRAHPATQTHYGLFEIDVEGEPPGPLVVSVKSHDGESASIQCDRPLEAIPESPDQAFRLLVASCFSFRKDKTGRLASVMREMDETMRPHLSLLMGDQVYLDIPPILDFPNDETWLARKFDSDYQTNWIRPNGFSELLTAAPYACNPDDHEYWNNFPHRSPIIQNTWRAKGRGRWTRAASSMYAAYQGTGKSDPTVIDVDPLSILVLDQRTDRKEDRSATVSRQTLSAVRNWVDQTIARKWFGAVVTGQSPLDPPAGFWKARVADRTLANYDDYGPLLSEFKRLAIGSGRPVLFLTGDVHWGRITEVTFLGRPHFYEIICSPASLVAGKHSEPETPPRFFAPDAIGPGYRTRQLFGFKGNQLATLHFTRKGSTIRLNVEYRDIRASAITRPPAIDLSPI